MDLEGQKACLHSVFILVVINQSPLQVNTNKLRSALKLNTELLHSSIKQVRIISHCGCR